jgi:general secretion pathway protein I
MRRPGLTRRLSWSRGTLGGPGSLAGFTLLETLVALAILAIGLAAAMRALGMATGSAAELSDRQLAGWVAQNRLAELRLQGRFPEPGLASGDVTQGGRRFQWHEETKPTANPLFRRVAVSVFAVDGDRVLSRLSSMAVRPLR